MSSPTAMLRIEIAGTCDQLGGAAATLLRWAALAAADPCPLVKPEDIRALAHNLASQGGRLSMAAELAHKPQRPPRPRCPFCHDQLTLAGLCSRAGCANSY